MSRRDMVTTYEEALGSRRLVIFVVVGTGMLVLFAPVVLTRAGGIWGLIGSWLIRLAARLHCHQMPERTLVLAGVPLVLCLRCTGIVIGAMAGSLAALCSGSLQPKIDSPRSFVVITALMLGADVAAQYGGLYHSQALRALTGLALGTFVLHAIVSMIPPRRDMSYES